jgi:hypothetical protein
MEISLDFILATITPTSLGYFFLGALVGYLFHVYQAAYPGKRTGRYDTKKSGSSPRRSTILASLQEPTFELPDSVLKTLGPDRMAGMSMEGNGNEFP